MKDYDLIIIGAGAAGIAGAKKAIALEKKVALIDDDKIGGECLWTGCVPSKTLINVAHHVWYHGKKDPETAYEDAMKAIHKATDNIVHQHDNPWYFEHRGADVYFGKASFVNAHTVSVGKEKLKTSYVLVATGSSPFIPDINGIHTVKYLTNEDVFSLKEVPKSLVIYGGGPIGCELAQAFNRLGVTTHLVCRGSRLLSKDDAEAAKVIQSALEQEGVKLYFDATVESVKKDGKQTELNYESGGKKAKIVAESLLIATGRTPNTKGFGLEKVGVKLEKGEIVTDKYLATSVSHIYVAGDAASRYVFTHYAAAQGAAAVTNMFTPAKKEFNPRQVPWVTFTDPELAHVGMTEEELTQAKMEYRKLFIPFSEIDRAITEDKTTGFVKILVDINGKILGCQIVGTRAGEMIHEIVVAMEFDIPVEKLAAVIHAYPTYSSGLGQAYVSSPVVAEPAVKKTSQEKDMDNILSRLKARI